MKRFLTLILLATLFYSCVTIPTNETAVVEQGISKKINNYRESLGLGELSSTSIYSQAIYDLAKDHNTSNQKTFNDLYSQIKTDYNATQQAERINELLNIVDNREDINLKYRQIRQTINQMNDSLNQSKDEITSWGITLSCIPDRNDKNNIIQILFEKLKENYDNETILMGAYTRSATMSINYTVGKYGEKYLTIFIIDLY